MKKIRKNKFEIQDILSRRDHLKTTPSYEITEGLVGPREWGTPTPRPPRHPAFVFLCNRQKKSSDFWALEIT